MTDILQQICAVKRQEIKLAWATLSKYQLPQSQYKDLALEYIAKHKPRDFIGAIVHKITNNQAAIIAEIKKASPSKGIICKDFNPAKIAQSYAQGKNGVNAACLSVLTDEQFFQGKGEYLLQAKNACNLPVLRKDFIIDTMQIYQSALLGADCILLIASCLSDDELREFTQIAYNLGLAVLVEVHNLTELNRALNLDVKLIGINNRNLRNFTVDINTTLELKEHIPSNKIIITESGIGRRDDVTIMQQNGINAFLVGEAFMRNKNPGLALAELFG